jgi:hypothetical protein
VAGLHAYGAEDEGQFKDVDQVGKPESKAENNA